MGERATAMQRVEGPGAVKVHKNEDLFERANEMFDAISHRAYELFENGGRTFGHDIKNWFKAEKELFQPVRVDITETDDALEVKAEVPGFNEKELEVNVEPRRLTITGKRETSKEEKKGKTVYTETCSNQIFRVLDLPADVEPEKATTTLKNGMLQVTLPKTAKTRSTKVNPKVAA